MMEATATLHHRQGRRNGKVAASAPALGALGALLSMKLLKQLRTTLYSYQTGELPCARWLLTTNDITKDFLVRASRQL